VAGLTFAPVDALTSVVPECGGAGECLLSAAHTLDLDFVFVPSSAPWAEQVVKDRREIAVMWVVDGPLWPVLSSGPGTVSQALAVTAKDPSSLGARLDGETVRASETVRRGLALGVDAIVIAEDLAGRDGLLFTPDFVRREVIPRFATLASLAGDVPVLLHSDGDTGAILPLLHDARFAAVHTGGGVDRDRFEELFWEARRSGLAMVGGIQTPSLGRGGHAAVRIGTHAALLAQSGGLLVADDGGITTAAEIAAFAAAVGAARAGTGQPVPKS
jgi:hypothetical protein